MRPNHLTSLLLPAAVALAVGGCHRGVARTAPAHAGASGTHPTPAIDESVLPKVDPFRIGDLDRAKSPCTDLYGYVNERWLAANPIPPDRSTWGPAAMLAERSLAVQHQLAERAAANRSARGIEKLVGDFYASGMDEATIETVGIAPLKNQLAAISALTDPGSIAEYLRKSAARGEGVLFEFTADADFKDSSRNIAYAMQGGLGLPDQGYYVDADKRDKLDAYRIHVGKVLALSGVADGAAIDQARHVVDFETHLAKASKSSEELSRDVSLYYNPVTPAEADKLTPHFPWTRFIAAQGIAIPAMFSLSVPAFHREVDRLITEEATSTWKAYLRFHTLDAASPYLGAAYAQENYAFYGKEMRGQKEDKARWKRVLGAIEANAGEAMGQLYVGVAFPAESKQQMQRLVADLGIALKARIENLAWMTPSTRQKALEKWAAFTPKIGYPDRWRDWKGLETTRTSYVGNVLAARRFNYRWNLGRVGQPVDRTQWAMTPQTVNAYYNPLQNELVFPAAILQPPAFDPEADPVSNFAAIGAIIGHEMIHGYDDQGSRFGPSGNFEMWWTEADAKGFAARTDQLVAQFDGYEALPGMRVNGKLTLGENIADLGGLNVAYDAMRAATAGSADPMTDGLTRDQRFFLTFATDWRGQVSPDLQKVYLVSDPHAPYRFRAIGAPSNMPAFAAAFDCKAGDPMVRPPATQVNIW